MERRRSVLQPWPTCRGTCRVTLCHPADLLAAGRAELTGYGVEIIEDVVLRIDPGFTARLATAKAS